MGIILSYSLAASLLIMALFPVIHQLVNRCTMFRFNRIVLLCGIIVTIILPLFMSFGAIPLPIKTLSGNEPLVQDSALIGFAPSSDTMNDARTYLYIKFALFIYYGGIAILVCREIISLIRLFIMIRKSEKKIVDGLTLCRLTDSMISSFSWGNYIFIHDSEYDNASGCIYLHEKAHTEKRHWIDVLLADLFCIFLWYNPFAWMTRQLIRLNHEFEADSEVLQSGISANEYQHLLIAKAIGQRSVLLANNFTSRKSSFRKRVLIMSKKRSSRWTPLIIVCAIPAIAISLIVVSLPICAGILTSVKNNTFTSSKPTSQNNLENKQQHEASIESMPEFEGGNPALMSFIIENMHFPSNQTGNKKRRVYVQFVVDENGNVINAHVLNAQVDEYEAEAIRIIELTNGKWNPAVIKGEKVSCKLTIPITFSKM